MTDGANVTHNPRADHQEKRQQVNDLELMIADFQRMANELDHQIKIEQQASGVSDVNHFAYPTFARAAMTRRDNLRASIADLQKRLERARQEALEAMDQLKLTQSAVDFEGQRNARSATRRRSRKQPPSKPDAP